MSQGNNKKVGIGLEDFLEFYLLDSQEQVDKLGSGLLQLEKDGENISLINELFRSVHSLKGFYSNCRAYSYC
jgi:two-component system chemotaxis sensor kinase CheA